MLPADEWPPELDALIAAPAQHRLLLENSAVRVLEISVPPGDLVPLHTHALPGTLYLLSWSDFLRRDAHGVILHDSRTVPPPSPGAALWSPAMPPHTLENIGTAELRLIGVELKSRDAGPAVSPEAAAASPAPD